MGAWFSEVEIDGILWMWCFRKLWILIRERWKELLSYFIILKVIQCIHILKVNITNLDNDKTCTNDSKQLSTHLLPFSKKKVKNKQTHNKKSRKKPRDCRFNSVRLAYMNLAWEDYFWKLKMTYDDPVSDTATSLSKPHRSRQSTC